MFSPQFFQSGVLKRQPCRVSLARQYGCTHDICTSRDQVTPKICQRSTLAHEVVHEHRGGAQRHWPFKVCLARQPREAARAGVAHGVHLHHMRPHRPTQPLAQRFGQHHRDGVDPLLLHGMHRHQYRGPSARPPHDFALRHRTVGCRYQSRGCLRIPRLRRGVVGMRLYQGRFGMNRHRREGQPRMSNRLRHRSGLTPRCRVARALRVAAVAAQRWCKLHGGQPPRLTRRRKPTVEASSLWDLRVCGAGPRGPVERRSRSRRCAPIALRGGEEPPRLDGRRGQPPWGPTVGSASKTHSSDV